MKYLLVSVGLYFFSISGIFIPFVAYGSDLIVDPLQNYLAWVTGDNLDEDTKLQFSYYPPATIEKIVADVNGDGQQEILLTVNGLTNGMQGNMWNIYTPVEGGYKIMGGITFHPFAFYVGDFEGHGWGVVTYFHKSSASGMLMLTKIESGRSVDTPIREIHPNDNSEDKALYERLFSDENQPSVEEIPISSIAKPDVHVEKEIDESNSPVLLTVPQVGEVLPVGDMNRPSTFVPSPEKHQIDKPHLPPDKVSVNRISPVAITLPSWTYLLILIVTLVIVVVLALFFTLRSLKIKQREKKGSKL